MKKFKCFLVVFILINTFSLAQNSNSELLFETKFYDAVDKWVAFPKNDKDDYILGFIYIDEMAGFTFDYENSFKISDGKFIMNNTEKQKSSSIKSRLSANTRNVAILSDNQITQLNLPKEPEWLNNYKSDENDVEYLKQIGYHYNHIGASKNALEPLNKAYTISPQYKGLEFELGFAYNATQQFEKAIPILENAIKHDSKNHLLYKELGYSLMNLKDLEKAEKIFIQGIENSENELIKAEMSINMCSAYFHEKNAEKYNKWIEIAKKYNKQGSQYYSYIEYFEREWIKKE